jgi:hypothetical protein
MKAMNKPISQDLAGGLLLVVIGLLGLVLISDLPMGSMFRIGPAFLPTIVSSMIVAIGAFLTIRSLLTVTPSIQSKKLRPVMMVLLAFTVFGLLIETAGLVISSVVLIVLGAYAAEKFGWKHSLMLAIVLTTFAVLLFSVILRLSIQVWPRWN